MSSQAILARILASYISKLYSMSSHSLQFPILNSYSWALRQAVPCNSPLLTSYSWALFYVKPSLLSSALSQLLISFFLRKAILAQLLAGHLWALFYSNQPLQFPTTNQLFMSSFQRQAIHFNSQLLTSYIHELSSHSCSARILASYISELYSMSSHSLQFPILTSYSWALRQAVPCNSPILTSYSWALFYVKPSLLSSGLSQLLISFFLLKAILAQLLPIHLWALFYVKTSLLSSQPAISELFPTSSQPFQFSGPSMLFISCFLRKAILAQPSQPPVSSFPSKASHFNSQRLASYSWTLFYVKPAILIPARSQIFMSSFVRQASH